MLTVYTMEQRDAWDAVVRSFSDFDVYYLSGYLRGFQIHGDGEPLLLYYQGHPKTGDADVRGITAIMKRDIAKDPHFEGRLEEQTVYDAVTPYGYGGWLIEGDGSTQALFEAYEAWCRDQKIVSEFVRYHPVLNNQMQSDNAYDVQGLGGTIAMDLSSPEVIWENITSKNRNMIRKAQKSGVNVYTARNTAVYEIFREIYNGTMDRDNASPYYYFAPDFYQSLLEDLPQNAQVFYAEVDGRVIAAAVMLAANGRLNYHLSGSLKEYGHLAPTNLILYEAALWGSANGCRTFHLGGGVGSGEDGLYKFKKSFYRGEPCRFHIGRKIYLQEEYQMLVAMRGELEQGGYFPRYRM